MNRTAFLMLFIAVTGCDRSSPPSAPDMVHCYRFGHDPAPCGDDGESARACLAAFPLGGRPGAPCDTPGLTCTYECFGPFLWQITCGPDRRSACTSPGTCPAVDMGDGCPR